MRTKSACGKICYGLLPQKSVLVKYVVSFLNCKKNLLLLTYIVKVASHTVSHREICPLEILICLGPCLSARPRRMTSDVQADSCPLLLKEEDLKEGAITRRLASPTEIKFFFMSVASLYCWARFHKTCIV